MPITSSTIAKISAAFLVATSTIGTISAAQHYITLGVIDDSMRTKQTLDESFLAMISSGITLSADERLRRSVEDESEQLRVVHQSIVELVSQARERLLLDIFLWVLVFIASNVALVLTWRQSEKPV
jgi:hypothetical protein